MKLVFLAAAAVAVACASLAMAEVKVESVVYNHEGVALEGVMAYDSAIEGPRPAVLLVHEWWGRGDHMTRRATRLAELGYAAFARDMYGQGKLTDDPAQARAGQGQHQGRTK